MEIKKDLKKAGEKIEEGGRRAKRAADEAWDQVTE